MNLKYLKKLFALLIVFTLIFANLSFASSPELVNRGELVLELKENVAKIEKELESQGTSVEHELDLLIAKFESDINVSTNEEEIQKIKQLKKSAMEIRQECKKNSNSVSLKGIYYPGYSESVGAVISYFAAKGYLLSAELLIHAKDNNVLNSNYTPVYGNRILYSSFVSSMKRSNKDSIGNPSFENQGGVVEQDLYYSIHGYSYKYTGATRKFELTDRYDFVIGDDYGGIQGLAVDTMYLAQTLRVIVPYYVHITV